MKDINIDVKEEGKVFTFEFDKGNLKIAENQRQDFFYLTLSVQHELLEIARNILKESHNIYI
jgi:tRNA A58 N-methylase Trm61